MLTTAEAISQIRTSLENAPVMTMRPLLALASLDYLEAEVGRLREYEAILTPDPEASNASE